MLRARTVVPCLILIIAAACSAQTGTNTDGLQSRTDVTSSEGLESLASPSDVPEWLRESFREAWPGGADVDDLLDRELNVLRLASSSDGPPAFLAWLSLDRLNGLGLLSEPSQEDPNEYVVTYRVDRPVAGVSFDQPNRFLILTVIEEAGSGVFGDWFRMLKPVSGTFREVWRGVAYSAKTRGSEYLVQRQGGLITNPSRSDSFLQSHVTQLLYQSPGTAPEPLLQVERIDAYQWDSEEDRFIPVSPMPGVGRYITVESAFTVPVGALNVFIAEAARTYVSSEGVLRLVNDDGQVVAAEASVEPGTHVLLWIPSGLAPGTYRVELAPELEGEAFDTAEIELVPMER